MREMIAQFAMASMAIAFLWHFSLIAKHGKMWIAEPNLVILYSEIALMVGLLTFAVISIIKLIRSK